MCSLAGPRDLREPRQGVFKDAFSVGPQLCIDPHKQRLLYAVGPRNGYPVRVERLTAMCTPVMV